MSTFPQDQGLDNLRQRATCMICREFYNRPKKLTSCSHSLCVWCLYRHIQANANKNFPPCPMCRKPILVSRSKIENLEPNLEVQDIVDFVKQYETCGLCNQKENPNLKCEECSAFVCDNCELCHRTLKPSHKVTSILPSTANRITSPKRTCKEHSDQPLDLFCIVCRRVLCVLCKEYNHANCEQNKGIELELYQQGFMKTFVQSSEDLMIKLKNKILPRVVYIPAFAKEAKRWLKDVQIKVRTCATFFKELRKKQKDAEDKCDKFTDAFRSHVNIQEIDKILQYGENCLKNIDTQLTDETPDNDVAMAIIDIEHDCLTFFKYRRAFPLDIEHFTVIAKGPTPTTHIQQISKCSLTEISTRFRCQFVFNMTYNTTAFLRLNRSGLNRSDAVKRNEFESFPNANVSDFIMLSCVVFGPKLYNAEMVKQYISSTLIRRHILYKQHICQLKPIYLQNNIYTNDCLDKSEFRQENALEIRIIYLDVGYTELFCNCTCEFAVNDLLQEKPLISVSVKSLKMCLITQFTNVAVLPCRSINEMDGPIQVHHSERRSPYLFSFIGNRERGSGLEWVFLYINSNKEVNYGLSVSADVAKFKSSVPVYLSDPARSTHQTQPGIYIINDINGAFVVNTRQEADSYWMSYRSISTHRSVPENFLSVMGEISFHITLSLMCPNLFYGTNIKIDCFKANLICNFDIGIHFVRHNDEGELDIGKVLFGSTAVEEHIILAVKSSDTDIPLDKLKPLTMVQRRNKAIVVVCAVEHDTEQLIMILTDRRGREAVEVLKIDYATSKLTANTLAGSYDALHASLSDSGFETFLTRNIAATKMPDISNVVVPTESSIEIEASEEGAKSGGTGTLGELLVSSQHTQSEENTTPEETAIGKKDGLSRNKAEFADRVNMYDEKVPQMKNSTQSAIPKKMETSNEMDGLVTLSNLQQIAESTITDLEMDQDGNIMFLLERKDREELGGSYCVCTKYFMP